MGANSNSPCEGPLLVGIFFNTYLYGLVTFQYASYHATSLNDPAWIKLFVFSLFVLDTFHSASLIYMAWVFCVENFSKPAVLREIMWPYPFTVIVISMTAFLTHMFLAYRVFRLKKNTFVYGVMLLLSAASWVTGVICGTYCWRVKSLMVTEIRSLVTAWLCLEVGADALVSGKFLSVVLSRSRTGFHKSDTVLNRLIRGSVQTGLFAGIFSIITLVCFLKSPRTQFFGMFGIPISRMYSNTLMDTLLVRHRLRGTLINGMSECEVCNGPEDNLKSSL
ncbi:hypothetical protein L208DRAFT_1249021 [Tricholoma matsutake]|nr:hypothetical protein L208DRAFT_1249021 [Tricholoma matsutake 945]